jgi:glyoxylate/hydroxypyruvate reductase
MIDMADLVIGSDRARQFFETARTFSPDRDIRLYGEHGDPSDIRFALAWQAPNGALKQFPNLEMIVSVGAGVDHLFRDPELPDVPIVRYIDPDLTGRMTEYVALHTLMHTRRHLEYQDQQRKATWQYLPEPAAHQVRVGIMGLGVLGASAANALKTLGYQVRGWTRTPKSLPGVECFAGLDGLVPFLADTDILVVLLPLTPDTRGVVNRKLIQGLSQQGRHPRLPGPVLINAGRGGLQVEDDILAALDTGELYAASLDVFQTEPLPSSSPFWAHPRVVITPHNAAESADESIVRYFLRQIERVENGEPAENIVDRATGY